ncbi:MAG: RDD family protein [Elusimicrobia bacterium]|nr:RDD family protein [Elusimicrobiota bacterium]
MSAPATRNLAILMTDIKGFTDKTSRRSRSEIQDLLDEHKRLVLPVLESRGGRLIKTIGDAFLMVYDSPTDAVLAGVAVQEVLDKNNDGQVEDDRIEIRIAINSGEVNLTDDDVYGEPVNITARIQGISQPGEVFFTEAVYLTMNKSEVPSSEVGLLQLKGIPEKVRVYKVRRESPVGGVVEAGPQARKHLWDLLRLRPARPLEEGEKASVALPGTRPPLWRRFAALCLDGLVCAILMHQLLPEGLFSTESEGVHIAYNMKDGAKRRHGPGRVEFGGGGIVLDGGEGRVALGKHGVTIEGGEGKVSMSEKGIKVSGPGGSVELPVAGPPTPPAGGRKAAGREIQIGGETLVEEQELYENGPLTVTKVRKKRDLAFSLCWVLYTTLFVALWRATPGKHVLGLQVVQVNGLPVEWKHAFTRGLLSVLSAHAAFLGYFWALWEKDRRGWHDLLAGTVVVRKG